MTQQLSTEQKRKELEAAGYRIEELRGKYTMTPVFIASNGTVIGHQLGLTDKHTPERQLLATINKAYEHLQRDTKLKALEQLALEYEHPTDDTPFVFKVRDIIKQFNITADDESDNE